MGANECFRKNGIITSIRNFSSIFAPLPLQKLLELMTADGTFGTKEEIRVSAENLITQQIIQHDERTDSVLVDWGIFKYPDLIPNIQNDRR